MAVEARPRVRVQRAEAPACLADLAVQRACPVVRRALRVGWGPAVVAGRVVAAFLAERGHLVAQGQGQRGRVLAWVARPHRERCPAAVWWVVAQLLVVALQGAARAPCREARSGPTPLHE